MFLTERLTLSPPACRANRFEMRIILKTSHLLLSLGLLRDQIASPE